MIAEGRLLKLQLVPSGVLYPHITPVIADGVVVDPRHLLVSWRISGRAAWTSRGCGSPATAT